jgi:hypothetical protein
MEAQLQNWLTTLPDQYKSLPEARESFLYDDAPGALLLARIESILPALAVAKSSPDALPKTGHRRFALMKSRSLLPGLLRSETSIQNDAKVEVGHRLRSGPHFRFPRERCLSLAHRARNIAFGSPGKLPT